MKRKNIHTLLAAILMFVAGTSNEALRAQTLPNQYGICVNYGNVCTGHRKDSAFAMHSVMKFPQAIYVAEYLRENGIALCDSVLVRKADLDADTWSPMLQMFDETKYFTYAELLRLSLTQSDNNACDLLFTLCGGPTKVETYLHKLGMKDIHIRWTEQEMHHMPTRATDNSSTPAGMVNMLEWFYAHRNDNDYLSYIWNTMAACQTGLQRIASVIPKSSMLIHKTGSGFTAADGCQDKNDVGIILAADGSHMSIAAFVPGAKEEKDVATVAAGSLMRAQVDAFLRNMSPDLQKSQTMAIRKAIDGDNADLMAVRNSRNTQPKYSPNVESRMITDNMRIYEPKDSQAAILPVLLYLHGGGWTFGSINSCGRFCNAMAASGKMRVIALDYRLAPENPYPAGLNDCTDAVSYIIKHAQELKIDKSHITIGGDSSGGNLALATALSEGLKGQIESLVLFYPVTKAFADGSESWQQYGEGYGLDAEIMEAFNEAYTLHADAMQTDISVGLNTDKVLQSLPRTLLVAAERDILRDQGRELAERMAGRATRVEYEGTVHLFITVPGQDVAFERAVRDATTFITDVE